MRSHNKAITIQNPLELIQDKQSNRELIFDGALKELSREFKNVWPIRTYLKDELDLFEEAFEAQKKELKLASEFEREGHLVSLCPSDPEFAVGSVPMDGPEEVDKKISKLFDTFQSERLER